MTAPSANTRQQDAGCSGLQAAAAFESAKHRSIWLSMMKDTVFSVGAGGIVSLGAKHLLGDIERQLEHHATGLYSAEHRIRY